MVSETAPDPRRSPDTPDVAAPGTGTGRMPGTDVREAARISIGECPDLPFVPELPARGVGADPVGRAGALLADLPVDATVRGWRIGGNPGRASRRAWDLLDRDVDAVEEAAELHRDPAAAGARRLRWRVLGPWSLSARLELPSGPPVLSDPGARRDVAESFVEGVAAAATRIAGRIGAVPTVVLDEPRLWRVVAGSVPGASTLDPVRAVPAERVARAVGRLAERFRDAGVAEVLVRAPGEADPLGEPAWSVLVDPPRGEPRIDGLVVAADALRSGRAGARALDAVGTALDAGMTVQFEGVQRWGDPATPPPDDPDRVDAACRELLGILRRVGASPEIAGERVALSATEAETSVDMAGAVAALAAAREIG